METTTKKFWPDAKIPEGAEYIGSVTAGAKYDCYANKDKLHYLWSSHDNGSGEALFSDVFGLYQTPDSHQAWFDFANLLRAHLANPSPAPQPPATRDELIDRVKLELIKRTNIECPRTIAEIVVDEIHPELKPIPPAPKTETELAVADFRNRLAEHFDRNFFAASAAVVRSFPLTLGAP